MVCGHVSAAGSLIWRGKLAVAGSEKATVANGAAGERVCVLVLGMHRSGTSALTRTLNLLGCDLPKTLVPEAQGNEAGHWESAPISKLNDALLESAGTNWRDFEPVNPEWFRSPKSGEFREKAVSALKEEFGASWLYVLKDPRICRIAGWWSTTIEAAGATPAIVSIVRHPLEVADSLKKRDNFDLSHGVLLWLRNTLEAEAQTRGRLRAFASYDGVLSNWNASLDRVAATLGLAWPKRQSFVTPAIEQFLSEKHRHHRRALDAGADGAYAWASEAFQIFDRWSRSGEQTGDYQALDRLRARLDEAGHAFARLVALQYYQQNQSLRLEKSLSASEKKAADLEAKLFDAEKRTQQQIAANGELQARLALTESALKQKGSEAEDFAREVESLRSMLSAESDKARAVHQIAQDEIARLTALIEEMKASGAAELAARYSEIATLSRLLKSREDEQEALQRKLTEREAAEEEARRNEAARIEAALKALAAAPFLPAFRGRQWRRRAALLRATGLFDADWYLSRYADIAETRVDPALHFLKFGIKEGRHPSHLIARARGEA
jgi:hypothetical protein